ncbi:TPA: hypothetical protein EYO77_00765 [Candidatus Poribacteria bacterium]|nr:hypothetical protein [Candidatus Poribacteria bacterium]
MDWLDDTTVENGCLKLFPGSHKSTIIHNGEATMDADLGIVFSLMLWTNQRQSRQRSLLVAGSSFMT